MDLNIPRNQRVGFVPTMGAFHEGHLQLMRRAKEVCDVAVASLYVNPTQFGKGEDFANYPRDLMQDAELAKSAGVDILFAPSTEEIYPLDSMTTVKVSQVGELWEGEHRPGHFDGVATIVAKLFNIVRPDVAFFGRKDFQQCAVIKRLVADLNFNLDLYFEPTVRESDGLAMSSRNRYLSASERELAPRIFQTLMACRDQLRSGGSVASVLDSGASNLAESGFEVDYLAYVRDDTLEPLNSLVDESTLICAARLGNTRLIDNLAL